jgi:hypothetical protein
MRKRILYAVIILCVLVVAFMYVKLENGRLNSIKITEDITDYNTDEYFILSEVFPAKIPENAQVITFSHVVFWSTAEDVYLELKFNTQDEMLAYLEQILNKSMGDEQRSQWTKPNEQFIRTSNIYAPDYEELFSTKYLAWKSDEFYTGYEVSVTAERTAYDCDLDLISYCIDDLTVIHTYIKGVFISNVHEYVPIYFRRFDVPIDRNHKRCFYLQEDGSFVPNE